MKSKNLITIAVLAMLSAGLVVWINFGSDKDSNLSSRGVNQNSVARTSGRHWFDNILSAPEVVKDPIKFIDASGAPILLNGLTVSQYVKSLSASAANGDATAAFNIYRAETICARIAGQKDTLNSMAAGTFDPSVVRIQRENIAAAESVCSDVNGQSKERLDYLLIAAKGGNALAQVAYFDEGPYGQMHDFSQPTDDQNIVKWQKDAVDFLTQAATQGNRLALVTLSKVYEDGQIAPQNLQLSLTYAVADADIRNLDPGKQTIVNSLARKLTSEQVSAAISAGNQLASNCCGKN
jgi:TPR repeat protein